MDDRRRGSTRAAHLAVGVPDCLSSPVVQALDRQDVEVTMDQTTDRTPGPNTGQDRTKERRGSGKNTAASTQAPHLTAVPAADPKPTRTRLQIEATEATVETLNRLVQETTLGSSAQVVRVAVQLLDELLRDQRKGASLLIVKDGQQPERLRLVF